MKTALLLLAGFALGFVANAPTGERAPEFGGWTPPDVERRIDYRPADRYEMMTDASGALWRLDKATGALHVVNYYGSFDIPEYQLTR